MLNVNIAYFGVAHCIPRPQLIQHRLLRQALRSRSRREFGENESEVKIYDQEKGIPIANYRYSLTSSFKSLNGIANCVWAYRYRCNLVKLLFILRTGGHELSVNLPCIC